MSDPVNKLVEIFRDALSPPPDLAVSDHAERHRVLPDDEAEPGPWRNDRTPYVVEILDRLGPYDDAKEVVLMKGCQLGGTEILLNALLFWVEHSPGRILAVLPGEDEAKDFSRQRLQPMVESTPALAERMGERSKGPGRAAGSVFLKEFPGGSLKLTGSNSPAGLRSKPVRYLLGDEVDGWAVDAGGEGCPLLLAEKRQGTFANRKTLLVSTPAIKQTSRIEKRFLAGDRRRYHVPCPECGELFLLNFANFVIPRDDAGEWCPQDAHMLCPECGSVIEEHAKPAMLAAGEWIPERAYNGFRRSYHLSSFYAPLGWLSWAAIADEWCRAQDNPLELKVVVNTIFGESWDQEGAEGIDPDSVYATREDWGDKAPGRILAITAGVDVQGDRLEAEVVGWAAGYESWSLEHVVIPGDPTGRQVWDDLDAVLRRRYALDDGRRLPISAAGVDSSYEADRVYAFCRKRLKRRIWAVKGASDEARTKREIWPVQWNKSRKTQARFKIIGASNAKRDVYSWLAKPGTGPGPGRQHFPIDRPKAWFRQLTAERMVTKWKRGFRWVEWHKPSGQPNEALDCRVYAYAVLLGLERAGFDWDRARTERDRQRRRLDGDVPTRQPRQRSRRPRREAEIPRREW